MEDAKAIHRDNLVEHIGIKLNSIDTPRGPFKENSDQFASPGTLNETLLILFYGGPIADNVK